MTEHQSHWEMINIRFGFIAFEKCFHCNQIRTYFSAEETPDPGEEYREGEHFWIGVENAQSFMFDLRSKDSGEVVKFDDLMGLMHVTSCPADSKLAEVLKQSEAGRTMVLVAFGFLPQEPTPSVLADKLGILTDYFNQRRDPSRPKIMIVPSTLMGDVSRCHGDFIHDIGMLSEEPVTERKRLL